MERIFNIINAKDFNIALTNLLVDIYSSSYEEYFEELWIDEKIIDGLNNEELEKLTKLASIIEYVGNRQIKAELYKWIYNEKLKLQEPYTPGVEKESLERFKRIIFAPREFSLRNVFYDEKTIKPM